MPRTKKNKKVNVLEMPTAEQTVTEIDDNTARTVVSKKSVGTAKCIDCGVLIELQEVTYNKPSKAGDYTAILPSHGRCDKCQTTYLINKRVANFIKACELVGNMKARIALHFPNKDVTKISDGLTAVMLHCEQAFNNEIIAKFTNASVAVTGFNISKAIKSV